MAAALHTGAPRLPWCRLFPRASAAGADKLDVIFKYHWLWGRDKEMDKQQKAEMAVDTNGNKVFFWGRGGMGKENVL